MKWSELPQEYRDLEKTFDKSKVITLVKKEDNLMYKFCWEDTPQGEDFWYGCYNAKSIDQLPKIPSND